MSRRPRTTTRRGRAVLATATSLACALALAVGPASADTSGPDIPRPKLRGWVGPDFTISINQSEVPAGRYRLIVKDRGTIHNFHIFGTGEDHATDVPGTGKSAFRLHLRPGVYDIVCDPHADVMNTTLTVT